MGTRYAIQLRNSNSLPTKNFKVSVGMWSKELDSVWNGLVLKVFIWNMVENTVITKRALVAAISWNTF